MNQQGTPDSNGPALVRTPVIRLNFLFWNLGRKRLEDPIRQLVDEHNIDIVVLAECDIPVGSMLEALGQGETQFHTPECIGPHEGLFVYARLPGGYVTQASRAHRIHVYAVRHPMLRDELLLVVAHLPSKLCWGDASQASHSATIGQFIRDVEANRKHTRTVVVGDLNMNPFEAGVVQANGLHAVSCRQQASRGRRWIHGMEYPYFYNPMWTQFGDADGPPGTYYFSQGEPVEYFWNMFDQVLIRPSLSKNFDLDGLRIVDKIGRASLLTKAGRPNRRAFSDHLPIVFSLVLWDERTHSDE